MFTKPKITEEYGPPISIIMGFTPPSSPAMTIDKIYAQVKRCFKVLESK